MIIRACSGWFGLSNISEAVGWKFTGYERFFIILEVFDWVDGTFAEILSIQCLLGNGIASLWRHRLSTGDCFENFVCL